MTDRITQGTAIVGGLEVEDHANVKSLSVETNIDVEGDIRDVDAIDFDTSAAEASTVGRLKWNDVDGTLDLGLKRGNVILQVGQETVTHVYNNTQADIPNGTVVRLVGSAGDYRATIAPAQADTQPHADHILGVTTEPIGKNEQGFVTVEGVVRDINTAALASGSVIWLSASVAGGITTTKPTPPYPAVQIGMVLRSNANNGIIYVHPVQNSVLGGTDSNVLITNPQDGDVLKYSASAGVWRNQQP